MSRFLKKVADLTNESDPAPTDPVAAAKVALAAKKQRIAGGSKEKLSSDEQALDQEDEKHTKAATDAISRSTDNIRNKKINSSTSVDGESLAEAGPQDFVPAQGPPTGGDFVPASPPGGIPPVPPPVPEPPAEPDPLTTEGETFLVNLARKALFVNIEDVALTDMEREHINRSSEPENTKKVAKIIRKIIVDYGLDESFVSKADVVLEDLLKKNGRVVVLIPGSFKPPHKGHYEMVRHYSQSWPDGQVHVLISAPSAKSERRTKDNKLITPTAAQQIFELYVEPLTNVTVSVSEYPSPVTAAYESLKTLEQGTTVVLGASKKDDDWKRWSYAQPWAEKEGLGLNILDPAETAVDVTLDATGQPYSAGNIRDNFDNFEMIQHDIPDHVDPAQIKQVFDSL